MTFLGNPAFDAGLQADRVVVINNDPPVPEKIVDVVDLADSTLHEKFICMAFDNKDCIEVQIECDDGTGAPGIDDVEFTWAKTLDPVTDPTTVGQWTADDSLWTTDTIDNSAAAIDRADEIVNRCPTWYRLTYQRTAGSANDCDFKVKIVRWKK